MLRSKSHAKGIGAALIVLLIFAVACTPKGGSMSVVYLRGNTADGMRAGAWDYGEVKDCQISGRSTQPADERGELLLCGHDTTLVWNVSWLRPDLKTQIYDGAKTMAVTFRSSGHSARSRGTWWECRRTPDVIECD